MNLLDRGYRLLDRGAQAAAGLTIRYLRGDEEISDELPAMLTAADIEQVIEGGSTVVGRHFVWQVHRAEMLLEGAAIKPEALDIIEWTKDETVYVFKVMPDAAQAAQAVDPRNPWLPASTKYVGIKDE